MFILQIKKVLRAIGVFLLALVICGAITLLTGCKHTEYVTVPEYHTDTLYQSKVQKDSVYLRDSIYVHEYAKGDTIFLESRKWLTKYVEKLRTDTIYQSKVDSVPVPYPVTEYVEKSLSWWQKFRLGIGNIVLIGIGIYFLIVIFKYRGKFLSILHGGT